jgi:heme exporter protein D
MKTAEIMIWGGVGALTVLLAVLVLLSFRQERHLRAEINQRRKEVSGPDERG